MSSMKFRAWAEVEPRPKGQKITAEHIAVLYRFEHLAFARHDGTVTASAS
jgi:hypothetical protein